MIVTIIMYLAYTTRLALSPDKRITLCFHKTLSWIHMHQKMSSRLNISLHLKVNCGNGQINWSYWALFALQVDRICNDQAHVMLLLWHLVLVNSSSHTREITAVNAYQYDGWARRMKCCFTIYHGTWLCSLSNVSRRSMTSTIICGSHGKHHLLDFTPIQVRYGCSVMIGI